jgi:hypothetical protein
VLQCRILRRSVSTLCGVRYRGDAFLQLRQRLAGWAKSLWGRVAAGLLLAFSTGVGAVAGGGKLEPFWLFGLCSSIGLLTTGVCYALQHEGERKIRALWVSLVIAIAIPIGAYGYHTLFDPAHRDKPQDLLATGDDTQMWRPAAEAGGAPSLMYPPVVGTSRVTVACRVQVDGRTWYLIVGRGGFLPQEALKPIAGLDRPRMPDCR